MTSQWDAWIGREQTCEDHLGRVQAQRWLATFDRVPDRALPPSVGSDDSPAGPPGADRKSGRLGAHAPMPQGIHLCLCAPDAPSFTLGVDGHPLRDDSPDSFLPPVPLSRRMWAASHMRFKAPITVGAQISRMSRIVSITQKSGSSGALVFVDVEHKTHSDGALALEETQTVVYRDAAATDAPLSPPEAGPAAFDPGQWDAHMQVCPDARLLFRYSALSFNTHRIHYDAPYARDVERYRGLVVHGPLTSTWLLELAARELGENQLKSFRFRGMSPAIVDETLHLVMRGSGGDIEMGAFADDGRQVTAATATL